MSRAAYAKHRGCAPNAVLKATRSGRITRAVVYGPGGKIEGIKWRLADRLWSENTDPAQALRGKGLQATRAAGATGQLPVADVWTDRALGRAVALARVDALEECQSLGFLNAEPLTPSELLDLLDVLIGALADRLRAAIGAGPAAAVHAQLLAGERDVCGLTLDQALELARGAAAKAT